MHLQKNFKFCFIAKESYFLRSIIHTLPLNRTLRFRTGKFKQIIPAFVSINIAVPLACSCRLFFYLYYHFSSFTFNTNVTKPKENRDFTELHYLKLKLLINWKFSQRNNFDGVKYIQGVLSMLKLHQINLLNPPYYYFFKYNTLYFLTSMTIIKSSLFTIHVVFWEIWYLPCSRKKHNISETKKDKIMSFLPFDSS